MLGIIKRYFAYISRNCFVTLYKSLVRSHLEYANSVWYPKRKTDKLEQVQKRATKLIPEISNKPNRERLKILRLSTLKYRRYVRDMIELFKIIKGIYAPTCVAHVDFMDSSEDLIRTRGNNFKLIQHHCHYDLSKFNFTNRVIPISNSLSNHVVSAATINTFKDHLDKFWCGVPENRTSPHITAHHPAHHKFMGITVPHITLTGPHITLYRARTVPHRPITLRGPHITLYRPTNSRIVCVHNCSLQCIVSACHTTHHT